MVSLVFDPTSREEIAIIERLLPFLKPATTVTVAPGATDEDRYWRNLRARLGNNLLALCLKGAELGSFPSLGHLAEQMGTPESKVQSWRRNLGRSERKANEACGTSLEIFVWDGAAHLYCVPAALREAILR